MCAPLIAQGELIGILYVGNDNVVNLFEERSLDVLTIFAGQASLILQNALLLDSIKTDFDQLKQKVEMSRFGDIIGSSPTMLDVFRTVEKVASGGVLTAGAREELWNNHSRVEARNQPKKPECFG